MLFLKRIACSGFKMKYTEQNLDIFMLGLMGKVAIFKVSNNPN